MDSAQRDARPRPDVISAASKMFAASLRAPVDAVASSPLVASSPRRVVARAPAPRRGHRLVSRPARASASASDAPPAIAPAHLRTNITPVPPEAMSAGGMPLADQPGMAQGFGDLTAHDFLRVAVDVPGVRVLNIDPPILTVDDFLTHDECDALVDAARASGEM